MFPRGRRTCCPFDDMAAMEQLQDQVRSPHPLKGDVMRLRAAADGAGSPQLVGALQALVRVMVFSDDQQANVFSTVAALETRHRSQDNTKSGSHRSRQFEKIVVAVHAHQGRRADGLDCRTASRTMAVRSRSPPGHAQCIVRHSHELSTTSRSLSLSQARSPL